MAGSKNKRKTSGKKPQSSPFEFKPGTRVKITYPSRFDSPVFNQDSSPGESEYGIIVSADCVNEKAYEFLFPHKRIASSVPSLILDRPTAIYDEYVVVFELDEDGEAVHSIKRNWKIEVVSILSIEEMLTHWSLPVRKQGQKLSLSP